MDLSTPLAPAEQQSHWLHVGDQVAPRAPETLADTGLSTTYLLELMIKLANTTYSFTTEWAAERLHLPIQLTEGLLTQLVDEAFLEVLGEVTPFSHRYTATDRGRERAQRIVQHSGYVGPAPVPLETYRECLEAQIARFAPLDPRDVAAVCSELILDEEVVRVAGLAASSGRSLFLFGPAGSGKTSLGRLLHSCLQGDLWLPYCLAVDQSTVRLYDPFCHELASEPPPDVWNLDQRWVKVRRPFIVVGGELTMETLDLSFNETTRDYDAPLHVKANGGLFLIDDLGRQRVEPRELLNRWIVPMEYGVDHLTLHTGQQVQVPFDPLLVVATNLDPDEVTDSAFLRRMGYRVALQGPTPERFREIFEQYAKSRGVTVPSGLVDGLLLRYETEERRKRCCDPRDLIDRVADICRFHQETFALDEAKLDLAWRGYFASQSGASE